MDVEPGYPHTIPPFDLLLSTLDQGVLLLDGEGRIERCNEAFARMSGHAPASLTGRQLEDLLAPERRPPLARLLSLSGPRRSRAEARLLDAAGEVRQVRLTARRLTCPDGRQILVVVEDVGLLPRAHGRTSGRPCSEDVLPILIHELRGMLAPLATAVAVLRRTGDRATSERAQRIIDRQTSNMCRWVEHVVSDIGCSRLGWSERDKLDLGGLAAETVEAEQDLAAAAGLRLAIEGPVEPLPVRGSRLELALVLRNLLENARQHTPRGGVITLCLGREAAQVALAVEDTGRGIPPPLRQAVFDLFVQGPSANERGLGLGLALVRRIVERHGGRVWADGAASGQGARIEVRLPLAAA